MITLDGITLPNDLVWRDEYKWQPVSQVIDKSLTGVLIIQEAKQVKGRSIKLVGTQNSGWITKSTLDLLKVKYDTPNLAMVLVINSVSYNVVFKRSSNQGALTAQLIRECSNPTSTENYFVTLEFITI